MKPNRKFFILLTIIVCVICSMLVLTACGNEQGGTGGGNTEQGGDTGSDNTDVTVAVSDVLLDSDTLTLTVGETSTLSVTVLPANATNKTVTWKSSDSSVAMVSNGFIFAQKAGNAVITATAGDKSAICIITVNDAVVTVNNVLLDSDTLTLTVGETSTLHATVLPTNATNQTITWSSSDTSVATVANGIVTANNYGTSVITATADDKSATCIVRVTDVAPVGLQFTAYRTGWAVSGYTGTATTVSVPKSYNGKQVIAIGTGIGDGFAFASSVTEIVLPDTIQQIGRESFAYCAALRSVTIPACLSVGANAFANCAALQEIELPASCLTIDDSIFQNCTSLKKITILGGTMTKNTLSGCSAVTDLKLGNVNSVSLQLIDDCPNLRNLEVANVDCLQFKLSEIGKTEVTILATGGTYIPDQVAYTSVTVGGVKYVVGRPQEGTTWRLSEKTISVDGKTAYNAGDIVDVQTWKTDGAYGLTWKVPASAKVKCYYTTGNLQKVTVTEQQLSLLDERIVAAPCEVVVVNRYPINKIEVEGEAVKYVDEFDITQYRLHIFRTSGEQETVAFSSEYLSQSDYNKLHTVGEHTVTVNCDGYSETWSITLKNHTFDTAEMQSQAFYCDGEVKSLCVNGVPEGTQITYANNGKTAVGEYTVTATLEKQYYDTKVITATLTVKTNEYSITYHLGLDDVENPNPSTYLASQGLTLLPPQRDSYEFVGWFSNSAFTNTVTKINAGVEENQTLYAKWQSIFTIENGTITGLTSTGKTYIQTHTNLRIDSVINGTTVKSIGSSAINWERDTRKNQK